MESSLYLCRYDPWNVTRSGCFRPFPRAAFPFLHCYVDYVDSIWLNLTQFPGRSAFFPFEADRTDCLWYLWCYLCSQPSSSPSSFLLSTKLVLWCVSTRYPGESAGCWDESFTYQRPPWFLCCQVLLQQKKNKQVWQVHSNTRFRASQVCHVQIELLWWSERPLKWTNTQDISC